MACIIVPCFQAHFSESLNFVGWECINPEGIFCFFLEGICLPVSQDLAVSFSLQQCGPLVLLLCVCVQCIISLCFL